MTYQLPVVDDKALWDTWLSLYQVPSLTVALALDLFESLDAEPDSAEGLAQRRGFDLRGLRALLPMLTQLQYLQLLDGRYQITQTTRHYLLKSSPFYWGGLLNRIGQSLPAHKLLLETVNGERANAAKTRPADSWESGHVDPELARAVTAYMHSHSMGAAIGMTRTFDFSKTKRLLDVGGGSGCFAIAVAQADPQVRCTVMELPTICELAKGYIAEAGVSDRVDTRTVDMFRAAWPTEYDTHFFSNIFHDWSFETCLDLARRSHAALPTGGRILLPELLLDDGGLTPRPAVAFSVLMAMGTLGQQFTLGQLRALLLEAGFHSVEARQTYGYYSIVSAVK
jgi:O-methyltransferase domain/Dimerisation domain